jgi:glycosyltransferase involved in cell wall biosynthesis
VCLTAGAAQRPPAKLGLPCVETGLGHGQPLGPLIPQTWVSESWRRTCTASGSVRTHPLDTVIPEAFDADRRPLGPGGERFAYFGPLSKGSGVEQAAATCRELGATLVLVGTGVWLAKPGLVVCDDGFKITGDVQYAGPLEIDEAAELAGQCRAAFCFPTPGIAFDRLVVEAMLRGTPLIVRDQGVSAECVKEGATDFRRDDLGGMIEAARDSHTLDRRLVRQHAVARFGLDAVAQQHDEWFRRVEANADSIRGQLASAGQRRPGRVVAVHFPGWLGVTASTRNLFADTYPVPADPTVLPYTLTDSDIEHHARTLAGCDASQVVFSGGDESHLRIAARLRQLKPEITVDLFWHGSYLQVAEPYTWHIMRLWMRAVRDGLVRSIVVDKSGMEDFFRSVGIPSAVLLNYVAGEVMSPPEVPASPIRAGMWLSGQGWRKAPYAMISAMRMIGDVHIHGSNLDKAAMELIHELALTAAEISPTAIPKALMLQAMRRTHVSMYVTLSECCPMLPLESMQVGVPCLTGPNSHLFEDNDYLRERLVVPYPDRADVIAKHFLRAYEERASIMAEYARYGPAYNARAIESVRRFIEDGPTLMRDPRVTRILPP